MGPELNIPKIDTNEKNDQQNDILSKITKEIDELKDNNNKNDEIDAKLLLNFKNSIPEVWEKLSLQEIQSTKEILHTLYFSVNDPKIKAQIDDLYKIFSSLEQTKTSKENEKNSPTSESNNTTEVWLSTKERAEIKTDNINVTLRWEWTNMTQKELATEKQNIANKLNSYQEQRDKLSDNQKNVLLLSKAALESTSKDDGNWNPISNEVLVLEKKLVELWAMPSKPTNGKNNSIDWKFGTETYNALINYMDWIPWNNSETNSITPEQVIPFESLTLTEESILTFFSHKYITKQNIIDFFNKAKNQENLSEEQKKLLHLMHTWLTTERKEEDNNKAYEAIKELQEKLGLNWDFIDWKFGIVTFYQLTKVFSAKNESIEWNTSTEVPENSIETEEVYNIPNITIDSIKKVFSGIDRQEIVDFFKAVKLKQSLTNQQKTLIQLAYTGLTTPREENPENIAYQAVSQLQTQLKTTIDWKFGRNTFNKLKQRFWMYTSNQENSGITQQRPNAWPRESIDGTFNFNANNYKYYVEYHNAHNQDICATYAYWVASDILASKWCCFPTTAVSSWDIKGQRDIQDKFSINTLSDSNPKQQITSAPAGTFLTMRYNWTHARESWVSHVMVSLGNWVYTDLFGSKIRKIDFKSGATFSWKKISFGGSSYTLSDDSRLMSPNLWNFIEWSKETINKENITPEEFANEVKESTWADINYIKSLIAKDNKLSLDDFNTKISKLSVKIIKKEIRDLGVDNAEWSNDVAKNFLNWIKEKKGDIMSHFHNLTNHEYDEIARRAMWILYQESDAWNSTKYWGKFWIGWKEWWLPLSWIWAWVYHWITWWERSRWYTQIKFNTNFSDNDKEFLKKFGIKSGEDLTNAKKCGIATMVALVNKYNQYIKPMKRDPFWTNDAVITTINFKDGTSEEMAKKKAVPIDGQRRVRTPDEIKNLTQKWASKHGWIKDQKETTRPWIKQDQTFFDYLYYSRNKPSEIVYWTASLSDNSGNNKYVAQCNRYMENYTHTA